MTDCTGSGERNRARIERGVHGDQAASVMWGGLGGPAHLRIQARDHRAELVGMNRADHRLAGQVAGAVRGDDPGGAAVLDHDLAHLLAGQHRAAVVLDAAGQRLGEPAAASHGRAEAVSLEEPEEHEHAQPRGLFIRGDRVSPATRAKCARTRSCSK